ncbi:maleylpyruvate isomerase family mycothiol-dependent enzyme [Catenulispora yoronensis]|uniref:Maleylpyruvate isomerase family mycothiol-dependent enzyme n=1 Tax=Catenulispora yoronensis TaxID=450799 RepID=A0ABP5GHY6_9ACTN
MMSETANPHLVHTELLTAEAERAAALLTGLSADDWDLEVPTCPGWTVRKVARHIGTAHRWATAMVRSGLREDPRKLDLGFPPGYDGYPDWIRAGAAALAREVAAAGADKPVWNWGPQPTAGAWARRMLHETAVHRGDMELALGRTPEYDPRLAADGVDEFLTVLPAAAAFSPRIRALTGDGETVHLHATDAVDAAGPEAEWLITLEPSGFRWSHTHAKGAAAVRGPVGELYLFVWGRRTPQAKEIEVLGDHTLLDHWVVNASF